jgi:hypothetical protein
LKGEKTISRFGASGNERQVTVTYEYGNETPESGKTKSITYPDGKKIPIPMKRVATPLVQTHPRIFTVGSGVYVRETITHVQLLTQTE